MADVWSNVFNKGVPLAPWSLMDTAICKDVPSQLQTAGAHRQAWLAARVDELLQMEVLLARKDRSCCGDLFLDSCKEPVSTAMRGLTGLYIKRP